MEHIRQAVERSRERGAATAAPAGPAALRSVAPGSAPLSTRFDTDRIASVELNRAHLEAQRVIAHDRDDRRSRAFDVLRTQVLQSMDARNWRLLAITSPTAGCGKTLTAVNLALSIARHPERSVILVDLDLQKPQIAKTLGLPRDYGIVDVLAGRRSVTDASLHAKIGRYQLPVLACEEAVSNSSELIASRTLANVLQELKNGDASRVIILDLPPLLAGDDVISLLPQVDCALFVTALGVSKTAEIKECNKHLQSTSVVRVVVNKASDVSPQYFYY